MDPERTRNRLSDYLDDELSPEDRAEVEAALERDASLRAELMEIRKTLDALGSLPAVLPPDDFLQGVRQKLRHRKSPLDLSFGLDKKIPFEAVSILLLGILLALYLLLVVLPGERSDAQITRGPDSPPADAGAPVDAQVPVLRR